MKVLAQKGSFVERSDNKSKTQKSFLYTNGKIENGATQNKIKIQMLRKIQD